MHDSRERARCPGGASPGRPGRGDCGKGTNSDPGEHAHDTGGAAAHTPGQRPDAHAAPRGLPLGRIVLRVPGTPQPGGSKRAFVPKGWTRAVITDANPRAVDWKRTVQAFAMEAMAGKRLADGPLDVRMVFYMARPKGHFGTRGLRASAPRFPQGKPDVLKLGRSTEDALTGIVWVDDARIVRERLEKVYSMDGKTGALIEVQEVT